MSINVRIYSHAGLSMPKVNAGSGRYSTDSLFVLKQPYLAGEVLVADVAAVTSSANTTPTGANLLHVQVAPGGRIHYEITPTNQTLRVATTSSPVLEGNTQLECGPGWRLSVIEAATDA